MLRQACLVVCVLIGVNCFALPNIESLDDCGMQISDFLGTPTHMPGKTAERLSEFGQSRELTFVGTEDVTDDNAGLRSLRFEREGLTIVVRHPDGKLLSEVDGAIEIQIAGEHGGRFLLKTPRKVSAEPLPLVKRNLFVGYYTSDDEMWIHRLKLQLRLPRLHNGNPTNLKFYAGAKLEVLASNKSVYDL